MARRKKPDNETTEQAAERLKLEEISNHATRSEKMSWNRMMDNMVKLLATLSPIEDEIIALQAKKIPIFDEVQELRLKMVKECIHPFEQLVIKDDFVECKFCMKKFKMSK